MPYTKPAWSSKTMHIVFLALGSNVGDKKANLRKAIDLLRSYVSKIREAWVYETKPVGYEEQDNFANTVLTGQTDLTPRDLLTFVKSVEKDVGRIARFRWGPREIDIDILFYDDILFKDETLEIPHPRLHERDFVLVPLLELAPNLIHPVLKKTIQQIVDAFPQKNISIIPTSHT